METKNEGVLTSLARTVGTTAGVIVVKTTQLKDEVVKMGSAAVKPKAKAPAKKAAAKKPAAKSAKKKPAAKKQASRAAAKKKTKAATSRRKSK